MKNLKISLAVVALVLASTLAKAQSTPLVQFKAGVPGVHTDPKKDDYKGTFGWGIGLGWEKALSDNFYFQPGLLYNSKTLEEDQKTEIGGFDYENYSKANYGTLDVPLYFLYKTGTPGSSTRIMFGFGPTLGFRIAGNTEYSTKTWNALTSAYETTSGDRSLEIGNEEDDDVRSFVFGLGVQGGVEFGGRFQVSAEWTTDLTDSRPYTGLKETTSLFALKFGILLNQNAY